MKKKQISFLLVYITLFATLIFFGYLHQLNFINQHVSWSNIIATILFFDNYIIEFCITILLTFILLKTNFVSAMFGLIIVFVYLSTNIIQFVSIYFSGEFLSRLAFENMDSFYILFNLKNLVLLLLLLIVLLVCIPLLSVLINRFISKSKNIISLKFAFLLILMTTLSLILLSIILPEVINKKIHGLYLERNMERFSPMKALYNTLFSRKKLDAPPDELIKKVNIFQLDINSKYPLIKKHAYQSPFKSNKTKTKNIIIFFTEGLSARMMGVYNSKFKLLTPNLNSFSKSSMIVNNYYNHTAATYRGIIGQICSIYPTYGGYGGWTDNYQNMPEINYYGLTDILKENAYQTIFFNPKFEHMSRLDEMAKQIGFDIVLNAEDLSKKYLNGEQPLQKDAVSDLQLYTSLIAFLQNCEKNSNQIIKQPFLLSIYNAETHAWYNVKKDGKKYANGENNTLNTIYNLDHSFGQFWKYYQSSQYSKNTIIIFTSDHAHYYEKSYVDIIKAYKEKDYQKLFVDKIPLIIHDPGRNLPNNYDAKYSTSIDFAPSLVHYLGLKNEINPFLGESIFLKSRNKEYGIASYGNNYYLIDNEKIHSKMNSKKYENLLMLIEKNIILTQQLEISNRIWNNTFSQKKE